MLLSVENLSFRPGSVRAKSDEEFSRMRSEKRYAELGWYFWEIDCLAPKFCRERTQAKAQYDSLTYVEKLRCQEL
jgi:hypothetical protein